MGSCCVDETDISLNTVLLQDESEKRKGKRKEIVAEQEKQVQKNRDAPATASTRGTSTSRRREAPSFLALDKNTGEIVWESDAPGHQASCTASGRTPPTASSPASAGGLPGGDGWLYSFEPETGKLLWKFDCNPKDSVWELGGMGTRNNIISTPVIHNDKRLHRCRAGSRARRGRRQLLGDRRHRRGDITESGTSSGTAAARTSAAPSRPPRSPTAGLHLRPVGLSSTASTPRPASTTGPTTPSPRSGARPSSPTARSTSATRTATWRCSTGTARR